MVRQPGTMTTPAFGGSPEPATFFIGPPQEEALARLEWLAASGQRCGLVVGPAGSGKSHLAATAIRRLAGLGAESVLLSLRGLSADDWLEILLERLPLDPSSRRERLPAWQKLENRLRENTLLERTTAILLDDLDAAPAGVVAGVMRLVTAAEPRFSRTLVVATAASEGLATLPESLRRRAAVRIELEPWSAEITAAYVDHEAARVGAGVLPFSPEAAATLARCAGGVPRDIVAVARLALAAAAGDGATTVDAGTVERAWRELSMSWESAARDRPEHDAAEDPAPGFRVVRRLWG